MKPNPGKLGRIPSIRDFRDHQYLASAALKVGRVGVSRRRWYVPAAWDQGDTSQCVAFSSLLYLVAGPVRNKRFTADDAPAFYDQLRLLDGLPMPHEGSTVRAAMKLMQSGGYLSSYLWAFDVHTAANWIIQRGPMVFGTDWLWSMFDTALYRGSHFIDFDPASGVAGGHAYAVAGVDIEKRCPDGSKGAFYMQNSWGPSWGSKGRAWLPFVAAAALIAEDGEAACAAELLHK